MDRFIYVLFAIIITFNVSAQKEQTFHFMPSVAQSAFYNPAFFPKYQITVGVPFASSIYGGIENDGFTYKDLATPIPGDSIRLNRDQFLTALAGTNDIASDVRWDVFFAAIKINPKLHMHGYFSIRGLLRVNYPNRILELVLNGPSSFPNQNFDTELTAEASIWREMGVGAAYKINDQLTVGLRLKLNKGGSNVIVKQAYLNTLVTSDSTIDTQIDVMVQTSNVDSPNFKEYNSADIRQTIRNNYLTFFTPPHNNPNVFGMDLGLDYHFHKRATIALSILDIGGLIWSKNQMQQTVDTEVADVKYEGVQQDEFSDIFDIGNAVNVELLSDDSVSIIEESVGRYKTSIPTKVRLSGTYQIIPSLTAGGFFFTEVLNGELNASYGINLTKDFGKITSLSLSLNRMYGSFRNAGLGVSFNLVPLQIYFASDNLINTAIDLASRTQPMDVIDKLNGFNFRFGINIVVGWEKHPLFLSNYKKTN